MSFWLPWQPPTVYTIICCNGHVYHSLLCISVGNKLTPYHEGEHVFLGVLHQHGADRANWTLCLCPYGPDTFSSCYMWFKTSSEMSQTNSQSSSIGTQAPDWNHPHWPPLKFAGESRIVAVPKSFIVLLRGYWIVASKKQGDQSGRGRPWTSIDGSISGHGVLICIAVSLVHLSGFTYSHSLMLDAAYKHATQ